MRDSTSRELDNMDGVRKSEKSSNLNHKIRQQHKILSKKSIQLQISERYKKIMKNLSQYCEFVMGSSPCKFTIVGMGSITRSEVTSYSDFEHIILLETQSDDKEHLK